MSCPVIELAQQLISRPSISPDDQGCQQLIIDRLVPLGFTIERMPFVKLKISGLAVVVKVKRWLLLVILMLYQQVILICGITHLLNRLFVMACYMGAEPPI